MLCFEFRQLICRVNLQPTRFNELLAEVMLRRTAEVNHEWLPTKRIYL